MSLLSSFQNLKLSIKLNLILVLVLAVIAMLVSLVIANSIEGVIAQIGRQRIEQETHVIGNHFVENEQQLVAAARSVAKASTLVNAVAQGDSANVRTAVIVEASSFSLSAIDVVDAAGERIVSVANEGIELEPDAVSRLLSLALLGAEVTGLTVDQTELEGEPQLLLSAAVPLKDSSGATVGALLIAQVMNDLFLDALDFERSDVHLGLVYEGRFIATDLSAEDEFDLAGDSRGIQEALSNRIWIPDALEHDANSSPDMTAYMPLTLTGRTEAVLSLRSEYEPLLALQDQLISSMTPIIAGLGILGVLIIAFLTRQTVTVPLAKLRQVAAGMSEGDYSQRTPVRTRDEIGDLAQAFNTMADTIQKRDADLQNANQVLEKRVDERTRELRIATREAQEASRLKDEFLSVMSHELRTPLNAIIGFQGILLMAGQLDDRARHMVTRAQANANRLLTLINDILDVSRIESGRMQLVPTDISPASLVERLQGQMSVLAEEKHLQFETDIDPSVPELIHVDEDAITKIIINLLGNAFKFTDKGMVSLKLRQDGSNFVVQVSDTGVGIPKHMHQVIFERFRQVDGSSKRAHGGSGLGLAIVQKLCTTMGGTVQVQSVVGEGSTFTVSLPLSAVAEKVALS